MSPQTSIRERAERFAGGKAKVEKMWGKAYLLATVDRSLSDFAFRVRCLFGTPTLSGGPVTLSHIELSGIMSCSERQAQRVLAELEKGGFITVARKHNCRNSYTLRDSSKMVDHLSTPAPKEKRDIPPKLDTCPKCKQFSPVGLLKIGWCRRCNADLRADQRTDRRIDVKLDERGVPRKVVPVAREELAKEKSA